MKFSVVFLPFLLFAGVNIQKGHVGVSYDYLTLPQNEKMGLLGSSYLYDFKYGYLGVGVYSAVAGKRGGFFTGGLEFGSKFHIYNNFYSNFGGFIGGGGGGSAPQGGGLMLRGYMGVLYHLSKIDIGLAYSKIKFPNGDIDSNQISLQANIPFKTIFVTKPIDLELLKKLDIGWQSTYISMIAQKYLPYNSTTTSNKTQKSFSVIGIEYGKEIQDNIFYYIEASGAAQGDSDGYAEIVNGIKYCYKNLYIKAGIGASGGGKVDTAGGAITKVAVGIESKNKVSLFADVGNISSIEGHFHALSLKAGIDYKTDVLSFNYNKPFHSNFEMKKWEIEVFNQTYLQNLKNEKINLIGFKLKDYFTKNNYISGTALGAYKGESGGYAVGLFGIGHKIDINNFNISLEGALGCAGGGGIDVGGGFVYKGLIGFGYDIDNFGLKIDIGKTKAFSGALDSNLISFGIVYNFNTLEGL